MATVYKLSYTASEIDEKLGRITDVDQSYNSESTNPQSGKAVAEAVATTQDTLVNIVNLIVDCFNDVAWASVYGETKLNALESYIDELENVETDEPETEEPEEDTDGYEVVRIINNDEISHLTGHNNVYPYYQTQANRESYVLFDIPVEYDYTYKIEYETACTEVVQLGFKFHNQNSLDAVNNKSTINYADWDDLPDWIASGTPFVIPAETVNNSPIVCMRMTFRKPNNGAFVDGYGVTSMIIKRKAGRIE